MCKFEEVLIGCPDFVGLEAMAIMGHGDYSRPSDAAQQARRAWENGSLTLESFCAARYFSDDPAVRRYNSPVCVCGKH